MASLLEAQIDCLGEQMDLLSPADRDVQQLDDAIAVALSIFNRIRDRVVKLPSDADHSLVSHWLRSAEAILPVLRRSKQYGHHAPEGRAFIKTILEARAFLSPPADPTSGSMSLDEVERELQSRVG